MQNALFQAGDFHAGNTPDNPDLASALVNLALVYTAQGKAEQAQAPSRRAREIRDRS